MLEMFGSRVLVQVPAAVVAALSSVDYDNLPLPFSGETGVLVPQPFPIRPPQSPEFVRGTVLACGPAVPDGSETVADDGSDELSAGARGVPNLGAIFAQVMSPMVDKFALMLPTVVAGDEILFSRFAAKPVPGADNQVIIDATAIVGREGK